MTYEMRYFSKKVFLNQIEYGPFRGCSQMEGRGRQKGPNYHPPTPYLLPGDYQTHPATIKFGRVILYLKEIQKVYKSRGTFHEFC